jgi:hypothetical protein
MIQIRELCPVNFFGHYHLDHISNNPKHNFGIITPDLLRNFTPNLYDKNLLHHLKDSDWQAGVIKHFERDKQFHQSVFFKETYNDCHEITKNTFQKNEAHGVSLSSQRKEMKIIRKENGYLHRHSIE